MRPALTDIESERDDDGGGRVTVKERWKEI